MAFGWDSIIGAVISTAGDFILGGSSAEQVPTSTQTPLQGKIAGPGSGTGRVPRPSTPDAPGVADVDQFYAEWFARMRRYASVTSATNTQARRS